MKTVILRNFPTPTAITIMDNGLTVASCQIQSVFSEVWRTVALGSREDGNQPGIAHFIEHMLFEGPTRDSVHPLARPLARKAIDINASTGKDRTNYRISDGEDVAEQLDVVLGMTRNIIATPDVMEQERQVILQELAEREPEIQTYVWRMRMLYPGHPDFHYMTAGSRETVDAIRFADMKTHHHRWYGPGNSLVSVASRLPHDAVVALVEKTALGRESKSESSLPRAIVVPQCEHATLCSPDETDNIELYTPVTAALDHHNRILIGLVCDILDSSPFGILYQRLRTELGIIYGLNACLHRDAPGPTIVFETKVHRSCMDLVENEYRTALHRIAEDDYPEELFDSVINSRRKGITHFREQTSLSGCLAELEDMWLTDNTFSDDTNPLEVISHADRGCLAEVVQQFLLDKPYGCLRILRKDEK